MKKKIILTALLISILGLNACMLSPAEKGPIDSDDPTTDVTITNAPSPTSPGITAPTTTVSDMMKEPFTDTISLEGTQETISCKTYQSELGYQMNYDVDRFTVASKNGFDSYSVENPNPELYPEIALKVYRIELPEDYDKNAIPVSREVKDENGNTSSYVLDRRMKTESGESYIDEIVLPVNKDASPIENVRINTYPAFHYFITEGKEWQSPIIDYYFLTSGNNSYCFEVHYYGEAAEGYGARMKAMLDSFTITE